jgi:hypothetical protein
MAKSEPIYTLKRCGSLASSGLVLDFESTNPLRVKKEGDEGFIDELHEAWVKEQEKRRLFDLQYASELRHEQVDNNLRRGRNADGRCAFCGDTFTVKQIGLESSDAFCCPFSHTRYGLKKVDRVSASECTSSRTAQAFACI